MSKKEENRFPLRLDDVTRWKIECWYKKSGCQSRNEFVERAVNFYADYLAGQENGVLPAAIQSAIDGRLSLLEDRMARILYKLAVETDMGMSAVLDCIQVDADYLRRLRSNSVKNVKATNGLLTFEQKEKEWVQGAEGDDQWQG
ncbi:MULTISPECIES: hypothetical protein [unclassified Oscillibacter]|jgi:hypothetical protein|uniref:hypothetical protein n=1 Tax=unclassified Oscillibacter TaxID=2629304 RepID=UPI00033AF8FD|nr:MULTISPECIES: hypothetical protein [unclassified Oscillibacter]EOS63019.1 hypothetical protein C816_03794 [Oscillibacter sp. 1-3]MCI9649106.1 hypothetical protein [Oscillibacter sp.]